MTYLIEIKVTPESRGLLEHLRTLKYVKMKRKRVERKAKLRALKKPQKGSTNEVKWGIVNKHLKTSKN